MNDNFFSKTRISGICLIGFVLTSSHPLTLAEASRPITSTIQARISEGARDVPPREEAGSISASVRPSVGSDTRTMTISTVAEKASPAAGKLRVTGIGIPPQDSQNITVRREMAERAALADAERKLLKAIADSRTGNVQKRRPTDNKNYSRKIEGHIKGYSIVGKRELPDGTVEIDLELPLTDQNNP